jgi:galactokinase
MTVTNNQLVKNIEKNFRKKFGKAPDHIARAPGRVNLLGEHVDYNDGFVMPAAIDLATYVAFSEAEDGNTHLVAYDLNEVSSFSPMSVRSKTQDNGFPLPDWGRYPAGVMHVLQEMGYVVKQINAVFASDVPRGSGLSSSASVEMAFLTAWQSLGKWTMPLMERAQICQNAENEYVGVKSGIMDQFASACGVENRLLFLDCRSLAWDTLSLPEEVDIVIADTTIRRKLTGGEYNRRHIECIEAVRLLKEKLPTITALRDVSRGEFDRFSGTLPEVIQKRARHVIEEIERTQKARLYLEKGDITEFGELVNESHASLRDLYEVSCAELDTMANIAQSLDGCLGARLTGAGFGGCTVNLVKSGKREAFVSSLRDKYTEVMGIIPVIYVTHAAEGAELLK